MALSDCEVEALDQAETSLALVERYEPFRYAEFRRLYDDLTLSADDLEVERDEHTLEMFRFCLDRWATQAEACLNRHPQGNP